MAKMVITTRVQGTSEIKLLASLNKLKQMKMAHVDSIPSNIGAIMRSKICTVHLKKYL